MKQRTEHRSFWLCGMCLTGVDYFRTLSYQPSIHFHTSGLLAPLSALRLVVVTLGAAETDFVITKTLSAADAAERLIHSPFWRQTLAWVHVQVVVTMVLLVMTGATLVHGFRKIIGVAVGIVGVYSLLNTIAIDKPDAIKIAEAFIVAIGVVSMVSRARRSTELRFEHCDFVDGHPKSLWNALRQQEFSVLVPHRPGGRGILAKGERIRRVDRYGGLLTICSAFLVGQLVLRFAPETGQPLPE